jgi:hypothetical protein
MTPQNRKDSLTQIGVTDSGFVNDFYILNVSENLPMFQNLLIKNFIRRELLNSKNIT